MGSYEFEAYIYDKLWKRDYKKDIEFLHKYFKIFNVKKILDIACGTGEIDLLLGELGYEVLGLDNSKNMIEVAKKKEKENVKFILHDALELDKIQEKFDAAICIGNSIPYFLIEDEDIVRFFKDVYSKVEKLFILDCKCYYKTIEELAWIEGIVERENEIILPIMEFEKIDNKKVWWKRLYLILKQDKIEYKYFKDKIRGFEKTEIIKFAEDAGFKLYDAIDVEDGRTFFIFEK